MFHVDYVTNAPPKAFTSSQLTLPVSVENGALVSLVVGPVRIQLDSENFKATNEVADSSYRKRKPLVLQRCLMLMMIYFMGICVSFTQSS